MGEVQRCHYEEMEEERKNPHCFSFRLREKQEHTSGTVHLIQNSGLAESEALLKSKNATVNITLEDKYCPITFTVSVIRNPLKEENMNFDLESKTASEHISTKFYVYPDIEVV